MRRQTGLRLVGNNEPIIPTSPLEIGVFQHTGEGRNPVLVDLPPVYRALTERVWYFTGDKRISVAKHIGTVMMGVALINQHRTLSQRVTTATLELSDGCHDAALLGIVTAQQMPFANPDRLATTWIEQTNELLSSLQSPYQLPIGPNLVTAPVE